MPITTQPEHVERYNGDDDHWGHVMRSLFEKAIEDAGFRPIRPQAQGSHLIHGLIIQHLSMADLVLVDLSTHNPNVFFELGVRTSLNLPVALVRDEHTQIPFDTSGINTHKYDSNLRGWEISHQQELLAQHISDSHSSCAGQNPLWRQFGLTIKASEPDAEESPGDARLDLLVQQIARMQDQMERDRFTMQAVADRAAHRFYPAVSLDDLEEERFDSFLHALLEFLSARHPGNRSMLKEFAKMAPRGVALSFDVHVNDMEIKEIHQIAERYGLHVAIRQSRYDDSGELLTRPTDGAAGC